MNKKQQAAIWIGAAFVICAAVYVPFEAVYFREGDNLRTYMGYRFFFAPPAKIEVYHAIWNRSPAPPVQGYTYTALARCNSEIVTERIWVEMTAIGLVALAVTASLGSKKNQTT